MSDQPGLVNDRDLIVYKRFDERIRRFLRPLVTEDLIAEHKAKPVGQHSDALERVLNYLRRSPQAGKYVLICTKPFAEWRLGILAGVRGEPVIVLNDVSFSSEAEAEHAVFLRRIDELLEVDS